LGNGSNHVDVLEEGLFRNATTYDRLTRKGRILLEETCGILEGQDDFDELIVVWRDVFGVLFEILTLSFLNQISLRKLSLSKKS
jgi:hypothetical protein